MVTKNKFFVSLWNLPEACCFDPASTWDDGKNANRFQVFFIFASSASTLKVDIEREALFWIYPFDDAPKSRCYPFRRQPSGRGWLRNLMTPLNHRNDWSAKVAAWLLMANFEDELVKWFVDDDFFRFLETWIASKFVYFRARQTKISRRRDERSRESSHFITFSDEHIIAH